MSISVKDSTLNRHNQMNWPALFIKDYVLIVLKLDPATAALKDATIFKG